MEKLYNDGVVQAVKFAKLSSTDCFSCSISVKRVMRATYFACPMFVTGDQLTVRATDSASNYICYCCMNDDCTMRGLTWMPQDGKMFFYRTDVGASGVVISCDVTAANTYNHCDACQRVTGTPCRVLSLSDRRYSLNPLSQTRID